MLCEWACVRMCGARARVPCGVLMSVRRGRSATRRAELSAGEVRRQAPALTESTGSARRREARAPRACVHLAALT